VAEGEPHSDHNMPYMIGGRGGGAFAGGRFLRVNGAPANRLLVSVLQAMGFNDVLRYGDTDAGSGPLAGLA
jgi:hypothetical protein